MYTLWTLPARSKRLCVFYRRGTGEIASKIQADTVHDLALTAPRRRWENVQVSEIL